MTTFQLPLNQTFQVETQIMNILATGKNISRGQWRVALLLLMKQGLWMAEEVKGPNGNETGEKVEISETF